jgi:hypothetical protein
MEIPKLINRYSLGRNLLALKLREALCACALQIISIFFEALRAAPARIARFFARFSATS